MPPRLQVIYCRSIHQRTRPKNGQCCGILVVLCPELLTPWRPENAPVVCSQDRASTSLESANDPSLSKILKGHFSESLKQPVGSSAKAPSEDISQGSPSLQMNPKTHHFSPHTSWCLKDYRRERTNLSPRFPQLLEETTWYRSLRLQGFPSSEAGDRWHPQRLFQCPAEPPRLEQGTESPEEEEPKEEEGEREDLPGEDGTPPTPCLLP